MVHSILKLLGPLYNFPWSIWSFGDPWKVIRGCSSPRNGLWNLRYIHKKIWYIQFSGYQDPYFPFDVPFVPLGTPWEVIGGHSPTRNKLWNLRYILKKFWYIQFWGYLDPYIISHGPCDPLGTPEKWLEVVPHPRTNIGTLVTSLRKYGTSNHRATRIPTSFSIVHLIF